MSAEKGKGKEPLIRMAKRDTLSNQKAWGIRGAALLLSLITGGLVILALGHNPIAVYRSMVIGAWGSPTVIRETIKIAVPLLITAIGISFAFKMKFWNIGGEGQIIVGAVAAGYFGIVYGAYPSEGTACDPDDACGDRGRRIVWIAACDL